MNRPDHQVLGAGWGVVFGVAASQPYAAGAARVTVIAACAALASLTAGGKASPDVDQWLKLEDAPLWARPLRAAWRLFAWLASRYWRWQDQAWGNPVQHRGITHWPGAAVFGGIVVASVQLGLLLAGLQVVPMWPAWALWVGWCSHLGGDLVHGKGHGRRGGGIPLAPWWGHHGVGWKSDGVMAHVLSMVVAVLALGGALAVNAFL